MGCHSPLMRLDPLAGGGGLRFLVVVVFTFLPLDLVVFDDFFVVFLVVFVAAFAEVADVDPMSRVAPQPWPGSERARSARVGFDCTYPWWSSSKT